MDRIRKKEPEKLRVGRKTKYGRLKYNIVQTSISKGQITDLSSLLSHGKIRSTMKLYRMFHKKRTTRAKSVFFY